MVATRSRLRLATPQTGGHPAQPLPAASIPPSSAPPHLPSVPHSLYTEAVWQQRRVVLQRRPRLADGAAPVITSRVISSADDSLILRCLDHSAHTCEFICDSSAPALTAFDIGGLMLLAVVVIASAALALPSALTAAGVLVGALWGWVVCQRVRSEAVLCVAGLGLTLSRVYVTGRRWTRFIDWANVEAVVINEAIERWRLVDVLCVVERRRGGAAEWGVGKKEGWVSGRRVVLLFERLRPRLCTVKAVYRHLRSVMYNE